MHVCAVCEFWVQGLDPEPLGALPWVVHSCVF